MVRRIAADPTSTALLLAAPGSVELWPGVRRVADAGGRTLVEIRVADGPPTEASVVTSAPRRTPTAYVSTVEWSGPDLPRTVSTLTLAYAPTAGGTVGTHAALQLSGADAAALRPLAEGFLDNLRRAAERRALAA